MHTIQNQCIVLLPTVFEPLVCCFGTTSSFFQRHREAQRSHTLLRRGLEGQSGKRGSLWQGKGDRAIVSGVGAMESDGGWREKMNMLMSSATCLNEVAGILWLQAGSGSGCSGGRGKVKRLKRAGLLKTPMKASFSFLFLKCHFQLASRNSFPGYSR